MSMDRIGDGVSKRDLEEYRRDLAADDTVGEEELLEFLAADLDPAPADPAFREQLREELWDFVQRGGTDRPREH
ncbi:MAG: hypothetical protein CL908_13080 [Deltaproteobacteria bacterium]|jgi:hypothetical protein|nr:hypothetical protein [Deltaproteobacteria bacterium]